jgi:structural maintenance of chromosome 4
VRICGRLGDLGTIDPKLECAITTACPGLDGIVVETDHDAI